MAAGAWLPPLPCMDMDKPALADPNVVFCRFICMPLGAARCVAFCSRAEEEGATDAADVADAIASP